MPADRQSPPGAELFDAPLWGDLGFRAARNPDTEPARQRHLTWLRAHSFFGSEQAFVWYRSWDLEGMVGGVYPYADSTGLDLCNRSTAFMTVFDDQFEGTPGDSSATAMATVRTYLQIIDGQSSARRRSSLGSVFADVWADWNAANLSPQWHARMRSHWTYCLTAMGHERAMLRTGQPLALDQYLHLRRGTSYMPLFLDLIELASAVECPRVVFHSPHITIMRLITMDVVNFMNDVLSLRKEMARGDNDNIVLTLQHQHRCSINDAIARTCDTIREHAARFTQMHRQLPDLCAALGLSDKETADATQYGRALELWLGGYEPWQRRSRRYRDAFTQRPIDNMWAFDMGTPR